MDSHRWKQLDDLLQLVLERRRKSVTPFYGRSPPAMSSWNANFARCL
jgi:hypothetical protein